MTSFLNHACVLHVMQAAMLRDVHVTKSLAILVLVLVVSCWLDACMYECMLLCVADTETGPEPYTTPASAPARARASLTPARISRREEKNELQDLKKRLEVSAGGGCMCEAGMSIA